jgi:Sulfotransferase family
MASARQPMPNFFIAGAPKAGTTSLYHYLCQHPEIYMSPVKEPNFFASEIRPENLADELQAEAALDAVKLRSYLHGPMTEHRFGGMITDWEDYLKLFRNAREEKAIGEASVCYLWSKTAAENIHRTLGAAKIILILRDPADRAYSQYLQCLSTGRLHDSFSRRIEQSRHRASDKFTVMYPWLEFGCYCEQVRRFHAHFGNANVLILLYQDYRTDLPTALRRIYHFLGVNEDFAADISKIFLEPQVPRFATSARIFRRLRIAKRLEKLGAGGKVLKHIAFRSRPSLGISAVDRQMLIDYYKEDIQELAVLIDRDLSAWLQ